MADLPYRETARNVPLGGLITLLATLLAQVFVIPWAQRRNRHLERWEDNITELATLVNEDFHERVLALQLEPIYWHRPFTIPRFGSSPSKRPANYD